MEQTKRLYRSESNRIISGVSGGLGDYFGIDPTMIRIIFVLATIFGGSGLVIYLLLWIMLPAESKLSTNHNMEATVKENVDEIKDSALTMSEGIKTNIDKNFETSRRRNTKDSNWLAYFLIATGSVILLSKLGLIRLDLVWPLLIIGLGLLILFK